MGPGGVPSWSAAGWQSPGIPLKVFGKAASGPTACKSAHKTFNESFGCQMLMSQNGSPPALSAHRLGVVCGKKPILHDVDFHVMPGCLTVLVGPNGCGKSTLLRALARIIPAASGEVRLNGTPIGSLSTRDVARSLALLPQGPVAPEGLTMRELVAQGRYPHQSFLRQWSVSDTRAVDRAIAVTDLATLAEMRLPRALAAAATGAALATAGALMQAITGNPLAEPATLGLMAGASSAVIVGIGWIGLAGGGWIPAFAAAGAVGAAGLVWLLAAASPGGARPLTLILSGAAVSAFLGAIDSIALLLDEEAFRSLRTWLAGSFAGADSGRLGWAAPWMAGGLLLAFAIARPLTILALGDETALALGLPVARLRMVAGASVVALTAAAVSVAGLIGFVGLVIPHVVRLFTGGDYARIVPMSALAGAAYLTAVDTVSRILLAPFEISTGLMTAIIGGPVFLWLVRTRA